jgi:predicted sulfurtransferase
MAYQCHCPPNSSSGTVLLCYRYFANNPPLPPSHQASASHPSTLAQFHHSLAHPLHLTGKLRLSTEGFNITIAGPTPSIASYITSCLTHWSFANLDLSTPSAQNAFFKPTPGCACVFTGLSVKVCNEITPMAITNYAPKDWGIVRELLPGEWHGMLTSSTDNRKKDITLLDVRNHYESALGYFVDGDGREAVMPQVRRFSQFPLFVRRRGLDGFLSGGNGTEELRTKRKVLSYCTGGIRCEKATRFMAETLEEDDVQVLTLKGGIVAYIAWVDGEIREGRMRAGESLFKGRNYVFDGRGSVGLEGGEDEVVGRCVRCEGPADKMEKCGSSGCRLELVVCGDCQGMGLVCCQNCRELDEEVREGVRRMCQCERDREDKLWGFVVKNTREMEVWKSKTAKEFTSTEKRSRVDISVRLIEPEAS